MAGSSDSVNALSKGRADCSALFFVQVIDGGARIKIFTSLRIEALDQLSLQRQLDAIGKTV